MIPCPLCEQPVKAAVTTCPHCHERYADHTPKAVPQRARGDLALGVGWGVVKLALLITVLLVGLALIAVAVLS